MLSITNLCKDFKGPDKVVHAVESASLEIGRGEFLSVQGPSGCGKTTLLLVAGGLLEPDGGKVLVDGQDPYALSGDRRARFRAQKIGFVFQQFHLIPYLTVLDNILAPSIAAGTRPLERAKELILHFNLDSRINHVPAELSTGERQRVALARSLLNQPVVLLADEPTGNLDRKNAQIVLEYLKEFARGGGAVLLVTHEPFAAEFAERTIGMAEGKLLES